MRRNARYEVARSRANAASSGGR
ncbi:hypothetical protein [Streptomyces sp. TP-A0356]